MTILIKKDDSIVAEVNGYKQAASFLNWTKNEVIEVARSGIPSMGVSLEITPREEKNNICVCAYTSLSVERYRTLTECAKIYGISRTRLIRLIDSGSTADDGITTFDFPLN